MMDEPSEASQANSSDYYDDYSSQFLETLQNIVLPGDIELEEVANNDEVYKTEKKEPLSTLKRPRDLEDEGESDETTPFQKISTEDDVYGGSRFGEFGEYMRRKRAKLQIQNLEIQRSNRTDNNQESRIFKGLSIYINGWTRPSVQDLRWLIVQHGGIFQPYLDRKGLVTHIISCSLTPAKIREFKYMKVVRPEWLVESVQAGALLPWQNFVFIPNERIEATQGEKSRQRTLDRSNDVPQESLYKTRIVEERSSVGPVSEAGKQTNSHSAPVTSKNLVARDHQNPTSDQVAPLLTSEPRNEAEASRVPGYSSTSSNALATRAMANPEWRKAHTSIASDYVEGYYKNSRLHHLSTWKSELKELVQEAQKRAEAGIDHLAVEGRVGKVTSEPADKSEEGVSMRKSELVMRSPPSRWKGKERAVDNEERVIMHCDFDCFFVSAGLVSRPELKGKPVVVCHSQGEQGGSLSTSEIASSSYEARNFGIKNGMSLQQARKLCPGVMTVPYEFERYKQISLKFYTILMSHADDLQAVSVDEALIDVTSIVNQLRPRCGDEQFDPAKDFAETIRAQVRNATGCELSIGISHNILLARLATRRAKPASSYHLVPSEIPDFLALLDIADLHGFGWSTKQKAQEKLGVTTLGELVKKSKGVLCEVLGKTTGEVLYNAVRGIDNKHLESDKPRKSVSCEINYGIRFENNEQAEAFIYQMAKEVKSRLDAIDMVGRSLTLKIMKRDPTAPKEPPKFLGHGSCDLFNKQVPLIGVGGSATSDDQIIGEHAWRVLKSFNFDPKELRGIGIQIQRLESPSDSAPTLPGQTVLPFKRVVTSRDAGPSYTTYDTEIIIQPPSQEDHGQAVAFERHDGSTATTDNLDLPSFSQVDMTVLDALPSDVREELENEYKRRSASPFIAQEAEPKAGASKRQSVPPMFPQKPGNQVPNYKRIAQQLAPRSRASISPQKSALFGWVQKKNKSSSVKISDQKLKDLGIDPEVFAMLPTKVQREQLVMARLIKDRGAIPEVPSVRKTLKPRKPLGTPRHHLWRAPPPKARYKQQPLLRQQGKDKKEKLYFTEASDIQKVVETWITQYKRWVPKEKDVQFFSKFLIQSVDSSTAGDAGVERAISIMKWWLVLLRRFWPGSELIEEGEPDGSQTDRVGQAWWKSFRDVKEKMDVVARKRFGGRLSLK